MWHGPRYRPRLERLEDRLAPGDLLGLPEPFGASTELSEWWGENFTSAFVSDGGQSMTAVYTPGDAEGRVVGFELLESTNGYTLTESLDLVGGAGVTVTDVEVVTVAARRVEYYLSVGQGPEPALPQEEQQVGSFYLSNGSIIGPPRGEISDLMISFVTPDVPVDVTSLPLPRGPEGQGQGDDLPETPHNDKQMLIGGVLHNIGLAGLVAPDSRSGTINIQLSPAAPQQDGAFRAGLLSVVFSDVEFVTGGARLRATSAVVRAYLYAYDAPLGRDQHPIQADTLLYDSDYPTGHS